jgi:hypothetical protein
MGAARSRVAEGTTALVGAAALGAVATLATPDHALPTLVLAVAGVALLAGALGGGGPSLVALALGVLGAAFAVLFAQRDDLDERAPLYAAGFLLVAELAFGALEERAAAYERGLALRRVTLLAVAALAAVAVAAGVLAAATLPVGGGLPLEALGVVAVVVAVLAVERLAARP